ncbi:HAMP domain-containing sensor histidine kinase [Saccharothrix violaceirubra]|uniref:histidine kinase n=1 Tax=Saccharothrix violaceirubra TaxID=413306 RepID=A0A7W7T807_9PSEU|nr:ATP-binding protein [Saccharothrix violaceirubra]MBB4968287.1 signal transduction histidine kinase [Saccharothrix violaceirubra]
MSVRPGPEDPDEAPGLRTVSLRRRVTLSALGVLAVVLIGVVLLVDALFTVQSGRDVDALLAERGRVAQQLVKQGRLDGEELVARLAGRGIQVRVVLPDGTVYGDPPTDKRIDKVFPDGTRVTLYADQAVLAGPQARLRRLLVVVGLGALGVAAVALVLVIRRALGPLDAMTTLAKSIAGGHRGYRLNPARTDNELGRTAAAFDDMLDSLEGSEERTKRFVADAAHELRTPIAGVQAVAEALVQAGGAEEREELNLLLVREARRAGRLVDDLLSLARIDAGLELHREPVDLLALAEAEATRTRLVAPEFDIAAEGTTAYVDGDPQRLAQVLVNLADNARQATGHGGTVRIRVSTPGAFAHLTVSDNGPGVPPDDRERIFDRLVRLDKARDRRSGGSGLGLSIARGVVRAHGGELLCATPESSGATFLVRLPLTDHPTRPDRPSPATHPMPTDHPPRSDHPGQADHPPRAGHPPRTPHPGSADRSAPMDQLHADSSPGPTSHR